MALMEVSFPTVQAAAEKEEKGGGNKGLSWRRRGEAVEANE